MIKKSDLFPSRRLRDGMGYAFINLCVSNRTSNCTLNNNFLFAVKGCDFMYLENWDPIKRVLELVAVKGDDLPSNCDLFMKIKRSIYLSHILRTETIAGEPGIGWDFGCKAKVPADIQRYGDRVRIFLTIPTKEEAMKKSQRGAGRK